MESSINWKESKKVVIWTNSHGNKSRLYLLSDILLGKGGQASVVLGIKCNQSQEINAFDLKQLIQQRRLVAVKIIQKSLKNLKNAKEHSFKGLKQTYQQEVQTLFLAFNRSKCENLVLVENAIIQSKHNFYMIMEYCKQGTLEDRIKVQYKQYQKNKKKILTDKDFLQIFLDIFKAIFAIQNLGIIHSDIKPQNFFFNDKILKLGDFGYSIWFKLSNNCIAAGTRQYNAPQKYDRPYKPHLQDDIYSIGVILYQILYGIHPYFDPKQHIEKKQQSIPQLLKKLVEKGYPFQREIIINVENEKVPLFKKIEKQVIRMCSIQRGNRPSCNEIKYLIQNNLIENLVTRSDTFNWYIKKSKEFDLQNQQLFIIKNVSMATHTSINQNIFISNLRQTMKLNFQHVLALHNYLKVANDETICLGNAVNIRELQMEGPQSFKTTQELMGCFLYSFINSVEIEAVKRIKNFDQKQTEEHYASYNEILMKTLKKNQRILENDGNWKNTVGLQEAFQKFTAHLREELFCVGCVTITDSNFKFKYFYAILLEYLKHHDLNKEGVQQIPEKSHLEQFCRRLQKLQDLNRKEVQQFIHKLGFNRGLVLE